MNKKNYDEIARKVCDQFFREGQERNFYSVDFFPEITLFGTSVGVESIWYQKEEDEYYIHCESPEFEGDIKISSLSRANIERVMLALLFITFTNV